MPDLPNFSELTDATPPLGQGTSPLTTAFGTAAYHPEDAATINRLAAEILQNPVALGHLCDRVYALMQQDLRHHRDRTH